MTAPELTDLPGVGPSPRATPTPSRAAHRRAGRLAGHGLRRDRRGPRLRRRAPCAGWALRGRAPLVPDLDPAGVLHGTLDDAARARLVVALAGTLPADGESLATRLTETYQRGDTAERRGVLRGLDALVLAGPCRRRSLAPGRPSRPTPCAPTTRASWPRPSGRSPPRTSTTTRGATPSSS
ncbi:hypothetical protein NKG05_17755 [Oerskovia sp. M15]